jgi:Fe-S cluster assembly iron-binding protein IscA
VLAFTDWAIEILSRADAAARRFNPEVRVRIVREGGGGVRFELTDEPDPADQVLEHPSGFTLLVQEGLDGTVDVVEPHDQLILRSPGDSERSARTH